MTKWLAMFMACLALGLVAVGCGDDDEEDEGGGGAAETTEQAAPTGGGGKDVEVTLKDFAFDPASITIEKGTTVKWTNEDSVGHDVTKTGGVGPEFSSGDPGGMKKGDAYEEEITTPGEIEYVCTVHPDMQGTITVTE